MIKRSYKKILSITLLFIVLAGSAIAYWLYSQHYVSTDDAYINANVVQIASRVSGQVSELMVTNNEEVKKGQVLFQLDPEPFVVAIKAQKAQLIIDRANLKNAQLTAKRTLELFHDGAMSQQARDDALAKLEGVQGQVELDQANLSNAELNLQYTTIKAPSDGWVSNMSLRPQDTVNANTPQFVLISDNEFWVDANFKETDLERIKLGASAEIKVDMYPNHTFKGEVQSLSGGSGNAFSLLPPQNATGNWVKVTQRVPVRIKILDTDLNYPLRIGTSATVTIPV